MRRQIGRKQQQHERRKMMNDSMWAKDFCDLKTKKKKNDGGLNF